MLSQGLRRSLAAATERCGQNLDRAAAYLAGRGIDLEYARRCALGVVSPEDDLVKIMPALAGRLAIPYMTPSGPMQMSFRCIKDHECKGVHAKYLPFPGLTESEDRSSKRLYFVMAYQSAGNSICLTEGELDALTLNMVGFPAMGVPGASNWQDHWNGVFEDFSSVLVFRDGDTPSVKEVERAKDRGDEPMAASDRFVRNVVRNLGSRVRVIKLPDGEDVNSVYVKYGYDGLVGYMRK